MSTTRKLPPADLLYQISNSSSVADFEGSFPHVRHEVERYLQLIKRNFHDLHSILDLGCGVGRFSYAMTPQLRENQKIFGCDLDPRCAQWSGENAGYAEVVHNSLQPPLPWADEKFDFIYALSVFTHLTFEHQLRWAWELGRLLKPGGVIMLTTHGLGFLGPALVNNVDWKNREYILIDESAIFAALSISGGDAIEGQREVATFHNRETVALQFDPLTLDLHQPVSSMAGGQSMNLLTKSATTGHVYAANVIKRNDAYAHVRAPDSPSIEQELRGLLRLPSARFDLRSLWVTVRYTTSDGTPRQERDRLRTPVCLGPHHQLSFRSRLQDIAPNSLITVQLEFQDGTVVPVHPQNLHWVSPRLPSGYGNPCLREEMHQGPKPL